MFKIKLRLKILIWHLIMLNGVVVFIEILSDREFEELFIYGIILFNVFYLISFFVEYALIEVYDSYFIFKYPLRGIKQKFSYNLVENVRSVRGMSVFGPKLLFQYGDVCISQKKFSITYFSDKDIERFMKIVKERKKERIK